ncbi:MAG: SDR family oxidoreductase [Deltaproteobacteria bacterium]|nr:SDR family oxidoreductase [Deltaproteobacteria bacterium]
MLAGKVAIVTGAARGIGRGIAEALADAGASVVVSDIAAPDTHLTYELSSAAQLEATAREIAARGNGRTLAVACDVTNAQQVDALVARTREAFGRIDLVVNNAGVVHFAPLETIDEARWDFVYAVNVKGPYLVSRAALAALAETRGSIVNIASVAGKRGRATGTLYCSSKFAAVGFTQALADEVAPRGVRVNAVCPGILATHMWTHHLTSEARGGKQAYDTAVKRMIPLGREQTPADIAQAVLYLATAQNVTGVALNVAGGMEVW